PQRLVRRPSRGGAYPVHHVPRILIEHLAEDGVLEVQVRCRRERDEELGTVRRGTSVRHCQEVRLGELQIRVELVIELVAGATTTGSGRVAPLNHETVDDPMEDRFIRSEE